MSVDSVPTNAEPVFTGRDGKSGALAGYIVGKKRSRKAAAALWSFAGQRVTEIELLVRHRHPRGTHPTDALRYLLIAFNHLVLRERAASARTEHARPCDPASVSYVCRAWARALLRYPDPEDVEAAIEKAVDKPRRYRADTVARILNVTRVERDNLGLRTIGAVDFPKKERLADAKARKRERDRERLRKKRLSVDRATYEGESIAAKARALGISRQAYYARQKRERERASLQAVATYKNGLLIQSDNPSTSTETHRNSRWRRGGPSRPRPKEERSQHSQKEYPAMHPRITARQMIATLESDDPNTQAVAQAATIIHLPELLAAARGAAEWQRRQVTDRQGRVG